MAIDKRWENCPEVQEIDLSTIVGVSEDIVTDLKRRILDESYLFVQGEKQNPPGSGRCAITVPDGTPIFFQRTRLMNPPQAARLEGMIQQQLSKGAIEPTDSPYSSPVLIVPKPGGKLRFVIDLRSLNKAVEKDSYTLPQADEAFAAMHGSNYFSGLDLTTRSGAWKWRKEVASTQRFKRRPARINIE